MHAHTHTHTHILSHIHVCVYVYVCVCVQVAETTILDIFLMSEADYVVGTLSSHFGALAYELSVASKGFSFFFSCAMLAHCPCFLVHSPTNYLWFRLFSSFFLFRCDLFCARRRPELRTFLKTFRPSKRFILFLYGLRVGLSFLRVGLSFLGVGFSLLGLGFSFLEVGFSFLRVGLSFLRVGLSLE